MVKLMKKAGCKFISLGVESGNEKILRMANKNTTLSQIENAVKTVKDHKIHCNAFLVFGHIGEKEENIRETINMVIKLNPDSVGVGVMTPWPGTEVWDLASQNIENFALKSNDFRKFDKFFGSALKHSNISLEKLESFRNRMYLGLYLENRRYFDFVEFVWQLRMPIIRKAVYLLRLKVGRIK
jgi:radical SAM superfamily enzyme YgiQ (UPF0313 family)